MIDNTSGETDRPRKSNTSNIKSETSILKYHLIIYDVPHC